jgi:hypothetical protein
MSCFQLVEYEWTTRLPTNTVVNETAYLVGMKNVLLMTSRDGNLKTEGFDKSTTMIDFDTVRHQFSITSFKYREVKLSMW